MPNHESINRCCLSLANAAVESPFGPDSVVYKVGGKIFALLSLESPRLNLKCEPERAVQLRDTWSAVEPAYHMSKRHWNSVYWERDQLSDALLEGWIRDSYDLICGGLSRRVRDSLAPSNV